MFIHSQRQFRSEDQGSGRKFSIADAGKFVLLAVMTLFRDRQVIDEAVAWSDIYKGK